MPEDAGNVFPPVAVGEEEHGKNHQLLAHGPPRRLEDADDEDGAHDVVRCYGGSPDAEGVEGEEDVQARRQGKGEPDVVNHRRPFPGSPLRPGVQKEGQEHEEGKVDAPLLHGHQCPEARGVEVEQGHGKGDDRYDRRPLSRIFPEPGFRVRFFEDLLRFFFRNYVNSRFLILVEFNVLISHSLLPPHGRMRGGNSPSPPPEKHNRC
ncbi:hypothetical protein SDC9_41679 [bioreactor metagenome]|uniref:Uncharacterized protein n=1 Tax=bioreactor metagenome TaxID=1076179 RepID=A0A644VVV7_9ZZZZ